MVTINKSLAINAGTAATVGKIIVLHSTDDMDATAANMATYEHRVWHSVQTFVHFGVDDKGAYQVGTPGHVAWGAGNVNRFAPVQLELCEFSDRTRALKAYRNWVALAAAMAKQYGVPKTLDDGDMTAGFKSHLWCSQNYGGSDHGDPYPYLTSIGISKAQLTKDLGAATPATITTTVTASSGKLTVDGAISTPYSMMIAALQKHEGTPVDGKLSSPSLLVKALQRKLGTQADGVISTPYSSLVAAMQRKLGTTVDGKISKPYSSLVAEIQRRLNTGTLPF
jgi:N-acetylmuramoyl-L-alanine amidase CwlA